MANTLDTLQAGRGAFREAASSQQEASLFRRLQEEAAVVVVEIAIPGSCSPEGLQKLLCRGRHSLLTLYS